MNKYEEALDRMLHGMFTMDDYLLLKELVEKATPKKPTIKRFDVWGNTYMDRFCPCCGLPLNNYKGNYCDNCGQRLMRGEKDV